MTNTWVCVFACMLLGFGCNFNSKQSDLFLNKYNCGDTMRKTAFIIVPLGGCRPCIDKTISFISKNRKAIIKSDLGVIFTTFQDSKESMNRIGNAYDLSFCLDSANLAFEIMSRKETSTELTSPYYIELNDGKIIHEGSVEPLIISTFLNKLEKIYLK